MLTVLQKQENGDDTWQQRPLPSLSGREGIAISPCRSKVKNQETDSRGRIDLEHTWEMVDWKVAVAGRGAGEAARRSSRIELKTHKEGKSSQSFMRARKQEGSTEQDPDILYSAH